MVKWAHDYEIIAKVCILLWNSMKCYGHSMLSQYIYASLLTVLKCSLSKYVLRLRVIVQLVLDSVNALMCCVPDLFPTIVLVHALIRQKNWFLDRLIYFLVSSCTSKN